ncbi:MAG: EAL domain-containing protein [Acidimicrobiales bacterium]
MADKATTSEHELTPESISEVIDGGVLRAVFQPIVDLYTDRPMGWEAFARVGETDDGFEQWLDSADAAGLGVEFQYSALHAIGARGAPPDDGILFVNVGVDLLADPRFLEEGSRLGPRLAIDVRGSDIDRLDEIPSQLDDLASAGIHLSIDDTTAASLAMIARVRPSFVKIDSALVRDLVHDPVPRSVIRAYLAFAEMEDIHVVAEGVERHEQLDILRDLGVRFAQGYLFGRPSASWSRAAPTRPRPRPRLSLDPGRDARRRFQTAHDLHTVADVACAELRALDLLASFYIEREGVLRCIAQLGYWQVMDGIPVGVGIMSNAFRTGRSQNATIEDDDDFIVAVPGIVAELAIPVRVAGRIIGVLNVESTSPLGDAAIEGAHLVALAMEERLTEVGATLESTALHRLARSNIELSTLTEVCFIETAASRLACEISGLSSALLAMPSVRDSLEIRSLQGPLGADLRNLSGHVLAELSRDVEHVSCCISSGDGQGLSNSAMAMLRESGASVIAAFSIRSKELGQGLLVLADHAPISLDVEERESLEVLARELGRAFDMAVVMADLRARATRDTLTGLGNLAAFQEALSAIGGRRRGRWAVAMADVDGFKRVNDTYGHLTGDRILRELASSIDTVLRAEDRMYRIGGDEFAAILHDVDASGANDIGDRMCEAAGAIMSEFGAGLSVGIALPAPYELATEFLERADKTLYEVKREARGTARVAQALPEDPRDRPDHDQG